MSHFLEYDVLIVGGGPAGSSCAWYLCRKGLRVGVVDKAVFPRDKPCAGWITPQIVHTLELDVDQYRRGRVWQPIYGFRCGMMDGHQVTVHYDKPISFGIRRCQFDTYLLERSGAVCHLGEAVRGIERRAGVWVVNEQWRAPMLVGAGGHFCPVARWLGARRQPFPQPLVTAQEVEFMATAQQAAESATEPDLPELFFCRDLLGYGWCFRKEQYFNIGLGRVDAATLPGHIEQFCQFLKNHRKFSGEIPVPFRGHAYLLYERATPRLFADGVVLIGDAAGLAFRQSGEGIRPAVESGLLAAKAIAGCQGRYTAERLAEYGERIRQRYGPPRRRSHSWLPQSWMTRLAESLLGQRWFAKHVVMDRWFLHAHQRPLQAD